MKPVKSGRGSFAGLLSYPQVRQTAKYMNRQVSTFVKEGDWKRLQDLTEFLITRLPRLSAHLPVPQELREKFESTNLDDFTSALYSARSRLIDRVASLTPSTIDELERDFQAAGKKMPEKFEKFFALARIRQNKSPRERIIKTLNLYEYYEFARICVESKESVWHHEQMAAALKLDTNWIRILGGGLDDNTMAQCYFDCTTYAFIEEAYSRSSPDILHAAHFCHGRERLYLGQFDKGIDSIKKAIGHLIKTDLTKSIQTARGHALKRDIPTTYIDLYQSSLVETFIVHEIDYKSAKRAFTLLRQLVSKHPVYAVKEDHIKKLFAAQLVTYAEKRFKERKIVMNETLQHVEGYSTVAARCNALVNIEKSIDDLFCKHICHGDERKVKARLFRAVKAAKESDSKYAMLAILYLKKYKEYSLTSKVLVDKKAQAMLKKIQDPAYKLAVLKWAIQENV